MGSPHKTPWLAWLAACFCLICTAAAVADSSDSHDSETTQKVLRFNVSPNGYPPYLIDKGDQTSGIMWSVIKTITERLGYQLEAHKVPRKRVDQMLTDGLIDGTLRAREWTSNPEEFLFTDPIVNVEEVVFFPSDSPHEFQVVEDLFSLTLVTHLGYRYPTLERHFKSGQISRFDVPRDQDLFVYVEQSQNLDAAVADRLVGQWILLHQGMQDEFRASDTTLSEVGFRLMLRPQWQSFARAFNRELAAMRKNGELEAILARFR